MKRRDWWNERAMNLVDASGAAGGGADAGAAAATLGAGGLAEAAAAAPPAGPYVPEGLDKAFVGKTERETLDNLAKHVSGLPRAPATPEAYTYTVPKELEGFVAPDKDPVLAEFRKIAHEEGLSQTTFENVINRVISAEVKAGRLEKPVSAADVFAELGAGVGVDKAAAVQNGIKRVQTIADTFKGLATRQQLSADSAKALTAALYDAQITVAFEQLIGLLPKEHGLQAGGAGGGQAAPADPMQAMLANLYPSMRPNGAGSGAG